MKALLCALAGAALLMLGLGGSAQAQGVDATGCIKALTAAAWNSCGTTTPQSVRVTRAQLKAFMNGDDGYWGYGMFPADVWSGAAYDPDNKCLYFPLGGGHGGYGGNEAYKFCINGGWSRDSDPHPYDTTHPTACHTYDGVLWNPVRKRFYVMGSVGYPEKPTPPGSFCHNKEYDPTTHAWIPFTNSNLAPTQGYHKTALLPPASGSTRIRIYDKFDRGQINTYADDYTTQSKWGQPYTADGTVETDETGRVYFAYTDGLHIGSTLIPWSATPLAGTRTTIRPGIVWIPTKKVLAIWQGGATVWIYDPASGAWATVVGTGQTPGSPATWVYSKIAYDADLHVIIAYTRASEPMWFFRLPGDQATAENPTPPANDILAGFPDANPNAVHKTLCKKAGTGCDFTSLQAALNGTPAGGVIDVQPGRYDRYDTATTGNGCGQNSKDIEIRGSNAPPNQIPITTLWPVTFSGACAYKAPLIQNGGTLYLRDIELAWGIHGDCTGAGIRLQGGNVVAHHVYFYTSENGSLGGGNQSDLTIDGSIFYHVGCGGRGHNVYFGTNARKLIFSHNVVSYTKGAGHGVKTRGPDNTITDNVIAALDQAAPSMGRAIDGSCGGKYTITGNTIELGPGEDSAEAVRINAETLSGNCPTLFPVNQTEMTSNTFICDGPFPMRRGYLCQIYRDDGYKTGINATAHLAGNIAIGSTDKDPKATAVWIDKSQPQPPTTIDPDDLIYPNRAAAGMPAFPAIAAP